MNLIITALLFNFIKTNSSSCVMIPKGFGCPDPIMTGKHT